MGKKSGIGSKKVAIDFDPLEALFELPDPISLFDQSDKHLDNAGDDGDDETELEQPEALIYKDHKPTKRELKTIAANEYLQQVLTSLPLPGVTWHAISNSRFNFFSFIPSVINYLGDYTSSLHVATWTTNNLNSKQLIELYDQKKIGKIFFVVGNYFKVREAPVYNFLASKLLERNQTIISGEHHAKILLLHNEDNYITIESSANLCANPRTEQFTYTNDKDLYLFYKTWFEGLAKGKAA
jgi:hypothetical protein